MSSVRFASIEKPPALSVADVEACVESGRNARVVLQGEVAARVTAILELRERRS